MKRLDVGWGQLACSDSQGAGPCLLFLHGSGCDSRDWDPVVAALPPGLRVVLMDFRGHGQSSVPSSPFDIYDLARDAAFLLEHLEIPKATLVGHSLGGMVAMETTRRTSRVQGLVLVEGWTSLLAAGAFAEGRFYGGLQAATVEAIKEKSARTRSRFSSELWDHYWNSVSRFDALDVLESARMPVFEVYGEMGRTPETVANLRVPSNPLIQWRWIPGGHYLPIESPQALARICLESLGL